MVATIPGAFPNLVGKYVQGTRPDGSLTKSMMVVAQDEETVTWARPEDGRELVWPRGSGAVWEIADELYALP